MQYEKIKETDKWVEYAYRYGNKLETTRANKYLCIGGPLDGQMLTSLDTKPDYYPYNRARGNVPKAVWVYFPK